MARRDCRLPGRARPAPPPRSPAANSRNDGALSRWLTPPNRPLNADLAPMNASLATAAKTLQAFADGPVAGRRPLHRAFDHVELQFGGRAPLPAPRSAAKPRWISWSPRSWPISTASPSRSSSPSRSKADRLDRLLDPAGVGRARGGRAGQCGRGLSRRRERPGTVRARRQRRHRAATHSAPPQRPQIVMNVQARDAQSFLKSESQIAAMMTRALARGQRNM